MTPPAATASATLATAHAGTLIRGLAADVGLPLLAYYGLHLLGVNDWAALLAAAAAAAARVLWGALRGRTLNLFATVMLVVFGVSLLLAFVSGDPRFLLLKGSLVTGAVGLTFLATTTYGRPLTLAAMQSFQPARAAELAAEYDAQPDVRRGHRVSSAVWGGGLLLESILRVPLVYLLPIPVMVAVSEAMMIATFAGLIGWNLWYVRTEDRRPQGIRDEASASVADGGDRLDLDQLVVVAEDSDAEQCARHVVLTETAHRRSSSTWQELHAPWHSCHSWQEHGGRQDSATQPGLHRWR
jgi:hypothetical protein